VRIFIEEVRDHDQVERNGSSYQCMDCRETPTNMWHYIIRLNKAKAISRRKKKNKTKAKNIKKNKSI
jgi:NADH:ubiquinone oxidoreductase subunit F (NADH-binding)